MGQTSTAATTGPAAERAGLGVSVWCVTAAFGAYFCMYGFRKPFTAGSYGGLDEKTALVTAQVIGYMLSKFVGIKVVAEIDFSRRARAVLALVAVAQVALLLFAVVPPPLRVVCLFLNGLPLGMVFGLVLGALEGRRMTEALTAGLCASFILADGVTKSVGAWLLGLGVPPYWMPFAAGLVFLGPLLVFVWMLGRIPAPSRADVAHRTERKPMNHADRRQFFRRHAAGLVPVLAMFVLVTILRSIRADFAPEIWRDLGRTGEPAVFTTSEAIVALAVMLVTGLSVLIPNNRAAFFAALAAAALGLGLIAVAVFGQRAGLDGFPFMVLIGLGVYFPYVAVHTTIFERLIAMTRDRGTIGYLMQLADALGYLGYVAVMFGRRYWSVGDVLSFFSTASLITAGLGVMFVAVCAVYYTWAPRSAPQEGA